MSLENVSDIMSDRFKDIAPLHDDEVKQTILELLVDPGFMHAVKYVLPNISWDDFSREMTQYKTKFDFQSRMISPVIWGVARKTSTSITSSNWEAVEDDVHHLIISNHRDIILDAGILNIMRDERGMFTTEIAIGDNLLIHPWIKKLVRLNKSFIVQRGVSVRQMLEVSRRLSEYIHYAITKKGESVWLAQREGRAKDSDDRTQISLLKMLSLAPESTSFLDSMKELNIVPLSISYEYDPCDFLKAQEFQLKRDNPEFKKSSQDDLTNMETGLLGFKGDVHFRFCEHINDKLEGFRDLDKKGQLEAVANCIDREIHKNYQIFPCNYIAHDMLSGEPRFEKEYTKEQVSSFQDYLKERIGKIKIENPDVDFLQKKLLEMYSNTLKNHLKAQKS